MKYIFYVAQSGKPFTGDTIKTEALGGSESAVVYMARELAKLGHDVTVFTRGTPGEYDGVLYLPFDAARSYLLWNPVDVLVCSRDAMPILWTHHATATVLWSHDVPQGAPPGNFDFYFFVSNWQAGLYVGNRLVPKDKARVTPNGIDKSLFTHRAVPREIDKDSLQVNLIWTSNPERGLWHAGRIFQRVRQEFPQAILHVFGRNSIYGWGMEFDHVYHPDDMEGVVLYEPQSKADLAHTLTQADLLFYPTQWPETFCIATLEAQMAGLPVISSNYGALSETVRGGVLVEGKAGDEGFDDAFAAATIELLYDKAKREELSNLGVEHASHLTWDMIALSWSSLFNSAFGLVA